MQLLSAAALARESGRRDLLLRVLEQVRRRYRFVVVGYVVMPEHIHLLISGAEKGDPSKVMQALKQGFARRLLKPVRRRPTVGQGELFAEQAEHVWQHHFYDFNVWSKQKGPPAAEAGGRAMILQKSESRANNR